MLLTQFDESIEQDAVFISLRASRDDDFLFGSDFEKPTKLSGLRIVTVRWSAVVLDGAGRLDGRRQIGGEDPDAIGHRFRLRLPTSEPR